MPSVPTIAATLRLLTDQSTGHTLNRRQILSANRDWVIFDGRNDDTHIASTQAISRVHLQTGAIEPIYQTESVSEFGPGVGAAACHPTENRVVFIHGLNNCDASNPYGITRRFGAVWSEDLQTIASLEQRVVHRSPRLGELSGGTHAHSWSPDGQRVSFTYNDALFPEMPRTVGFSCLRLPPPTWDPAEKCDTRESFAGMAASFLLCRPPTKEGLLQALEECWIDNDRIAFLGTIARTPHSDERIQEIFVAQLPSDSAIRDLMRASNGSPNGDHALLSQWESMVTIKRLTHLSDRSHPGIQGPRHWLIADSKRNSIFSLWRDDRGFPQIIEVNLISGSCQQLTDMEAGVTEAFSYDPSTEQIAFISNNQIYVLGLPNKKLHRILTTDFLDSQGNKIAEPRWHGGYVGAPHPSDANNWLINRYVHRPEGAFLQILHCRALTPIS
ncbi:DUF3748 domain-containing protein [Pirellulaceae bacterium SH501]